MNKAVRLIVALSVLLILCSMVSAQEVPKGSDSPLARLTQLYGELPAIIKSGDVHLLDQLISRIRATAAEGGISDVEFISQDLRARAVLSAFQGDTVVASKLLEAGYALSPTSISFLIDAASLRSRLSDRSSLRELIHALRNIRGTEILSIIHGIIPLIAWASVFSMLIILCATILISLPVYFTLRKGTSSGGVMSAILISIVLFAPLYLGPLWTLFSWGATITVLHRRYSNVALFAGLTLCFWAAGQEIEEQRALWRSDRPMQEAAALAESRLLSLPSQMVHLRAQGGEHQLFSLASARLFRLSGMTNEALNQVTGLQERYPNDPTYKMEEALLRAAAGDYKRADTLYSEAVGASSQSTKEFLNQSKIKYALTEISAGEDLFARARDKNPEFVLQQQELESLEGINPMKVWHWPAPSVSIVYDAAHFKLADTGFFSTPLATMGGATRSIAFMLGITICGISLILPSEGRRSGQRPLETLLRPVWLFLRIIPGSMLIARYAMTKALVIVLVFVIGIFVFTGWPYQIAEFSLFYPDIKAYGALIAAISGMTSIIWGSLTLPSPVTDPEVGLSPIARALVIMFLISVLIVPALFWGGMLRITSL